MKKIALLVLAFGMLLSTSASAANIKANANATVKKNTITVKQSTSAIVDVNTLKQEIKNLQTERKTKLSQILTQARQGSRSTGVTTLQTLLALDPTLYPEGFVTGYFGPMTAKAVKKFQARYGIAQVGSVGPLTLEKLKQFADENSITVEDETEDEDDNTTSTAIAKGLARKLCAIVPPGHLIAPGLLKKTGGIRPTVPECQTLPKGIRNKLDGVKPLPDANDKTAPVISAVATSEISAASVKFTWTTNELSTSKVWYGTTNPVDLANATVATDNAYVTSHSVVVNGLTASTVYYFIVASTDASANGSQGTQGTFTTLATDTTGPVISALTSSDLTSTGVKITWSTNEGAKDKVWISTTSPVVTSGAPTVEDTTLRTAHSFDLTGLTANTVYYYVVTSTDSSGNATTATQGTFTTPALDTTDPVISVLTTTDITSTGAKITWTTDEGAKDKVWYSTTTPVVTSGAPNVEDTTLRTAHTFSLTGLVANTQYFYVVSSIDAALNDAVSTEGTFTTLP